ncbi:MAG: threonine synthase, partial [Acidimicrobiia bacterium]
VATNINRGLADLLETGSLEAKRAVLTTSPAMDIQVPSNLERALFEATGRDPEPVAAAMAKLASDGVLTVTEKQLTRLRETYEGQAVNEEEAAAEIAEFQREHGRLIDPHTAVGLSAARGKRDPDRPMVVMATAHPAKFPEAVGRASGVMPALPERFAELFDLPERITHVRNDYDLVRELVLNAAGGRDRDS